MKKFSKKEITCLETALLHLKENGITRGAYNGWYYGKKDAFIKEVNEATEFIERIISENKKKQMSK